MSDELKECREAFEADCRDRYLSIETTLNAWGRPVYLPFIQARYEGFIAAWNRRQPEAKALTRAQMIWALAPKWAVQAGVFEDQISFWSAEDIVSGHDIEGVKWIPKPTDIPALPPDLSAKDGE